ncbi:MAG TPA: NAD(P)H-dependent oxidoreductase [Nitrososphaerales archaeon]|nr:NAD(P)H-dependent oxidoreductase [Nitrososphaerales archaeon]
MTGDLDFRILGISGSGRKGSYNTALLRAAEDLLPKGATLELYDVAKLPLYNQDLEAEPPTVVSEFKTRIEESRAILFATPEHNYSVSAVMKNALEWGNRPEGHNSWDGKPAAIMSASSGPRGGARAQLHLRQIFVDVNVYPMNEPQLFVSNEGTKFDGDLRLTDSRTRESLRELLLALVQWARRLNP